MYTCMLSLVVHNYIPGIIHPTLTSSQINTPSLSGTCSPSFSRSDLYIHHIVEHLEAMTFRQYHVMCYVDA